jgi:SAM-dependent methyltransferase
VGVDFNPEYVAYARTRGRADNLENLHFEQGDVCALQFASASFDLVWSRFVLYFLPKPEEAIQEFRRVLKPDGEVVIALHNWSTLINYPEDESLRLRRDRVFSSMADTYLAQKMPSILSACGFSDISVSIELDRVYSAVGAIRTDGRQNYAEVLNAGMKIAVQALGGKVEAEKFAADTLAYLDRPDTYTYSLLWTIKCRAPL